MSTLKVNALQDTSGKGFYPSQAWANVNQRGTTSIRDDENVSSITDNGVGDFTLTFSNSTPVSTWSLTAMGCCYGPSDPGNEYALLRSSSGTNWSDPYFSTQNCRVEVGQGGQANVDMGYIGVNVVC